MKLTLKKNAGFSLVESLAAMGLLMLVGLLLAYFSSNRLSQVTNKQNVSCLAHANGTLDKIRSLGGAKSVMSLNPETNELERPPTEEGAIQLIRQRDEWADTGDRIWQRPANPEGEGPAKVVLNNYKALIGSMSLLNSLYARDPRYCSQSQGLSYNLSGVPQELLESGDFEHLKNAISTIRIQPYDLNDGTAQDCEANLKILPPGTVPGHPLAAFEGITVLPPGTRNDRGFLVTVFTNYEDLDGSTKSCSASAQYSYPNVSVNATTLSDLSVSVRRSTLPGVINDAPNVSVCASTVPVVEVQVLTSTTNYNETHGMVMMCLDGSAYDPTPPETSCIGAPTPSNTISNFGEWVSCSQLRICGQAAVNAETSQTPNGFVLRYENVSVACRVRVEARLIDLPQNITENASEGELAPPGRVGCENSCSSDPDSDSLIPGWCSGGGRTIASSCPVPEPPISATDGGDGTDGAADGSDSDGKGADGGDSGFN